MAGYSPWCCKELEMTKHACKSIIRQWWLSLPGTLNRQTQLPVHLILKQNKTKKTCFLLVFFSKIVLNLTFPHHFMHVTEINSLSSLNEEVLEIHHTARGLPQSTFFSMLLSVIDKLVRYSECSLRWFDLHVRCERIPPPQLVKLSHLSPHKYIVYLKFTKRESFKDSHHKNPTNCVRWWTCWSASSWWSLHRVCVY